MKRRHCTANNVSAKTQMQIIHTKFRNAKEKKEYKEQHEVAHAVLRF